MACIGVPAVSEKHHARVPRMSDPTGQGATRSAASLGQRGATPTRAGAGGVLAGGGSTDGAGCGSAGGAPSPLAGGRGARKGHCGTARSRSPHGRWNQAIGVIQAVAMVTSRQRGSRGAARELPRAPRACCAVAVILVARQPRLRRPVPILPGERICPGAPWFHLVSLPGPDPPRLPSSGGSGLQRGYAPAVCTKSCTMLVASDRPRVHCFTPPAGEA